MEDAISVAGKIAMPFELGPRGVLGICVATASTAPTAKDRGRLTTYIQYVVRLATDPAARRSSWWHSRPAPRQAWRLGETDRRAEGFPSPAENPTNREPA